MEQYYLLLEHPKDYKQAIYKENYSGWDIYFSRNGDWGKTTHIDDIRYDRSMNDLDEAGVLTGIKHLIDELGVPDDSELSHIKNKINLVAYQKLKKRQANGYVKICLHLENYNVKIIVDSFDDGGKEKRMVVRTILKKIYKDNGEIALFSREMFLDIPTIIIV